MLEKAKEHTNLSELKIKKLKEQHNEEVNNVMVEYLKLKEELSNVVKERQRLKESERILVNTFDTLKKYYEKPEDIVVCSLCGLSCSNESDLKKHRQTAHTQIFACISCKYESASRSDFEKHAGTHKQTDEKTGYKCEICGMEAMSLEAMETHVTSTHTCVECKSLHKDLYHLNRHKEKEHGIKCNICGFVSGSESSFQKHMETHRVEKYTCDVCGKNENSQVKVDEHIQTVHVREMYEHFMKTSSKKPQEQNTDRRRQHRAADSGKVYSYEERRMNGECSFFNRGCCSYGIYCRFSHEETPSCRFQELCNRKSTCQFFHPVKTNNMRSSFLDQRAGRWNQF